MEPTTRKVPPELEDLADQIGEFIEFWGFKKVHGRLWTHLLLSSAPLDAAQLIERLGISKALVSMTLQDLLNYRVIEVAGKSARQTQLYRPNLDVFDVIISVLRSRERRMLARIAASYSLMQALRAEEYRRFGIDLERLRFLGKLVEGVSKAFDNFLTGFRLDLTAVRALRLIRSARNVTHRRP